MERNIVCSILAFFLCTNLFSQNIVWEVNDATTWNNIRQGGSNLTISAEGLARPSNASNDYTFESKSITFDRLVDAQDIVFKQSPVWDNWSAAGNIQPNGAGDAPVIVPVGDNNYYFLGLGNTGGYHAWHSTNMQNWTHKGPVTPPGIGRWVTSAEMLNGSFYIYCLLYTSPSPRDKRQSRMPSSA